MALQVGSPARGGVEVRWGIFAKCFAYSAGMGHKLFDGESFENSALRFNTEVC